ALLLPPTSTLFPYTTLFRSAYLEACRQLAYEEGEHSVIFVALTYVLEPGALGEQKSKAAQLGIKRLMEMGIMPHIIACRAARPRSEEHTSELQSRVDLVCRL